jgi:integrase
MYSHPLRPRRDPKLEQRKNGYWYVVFNQRGKRRKTIATGIKSRHHEASLAHLPSEVTDLMVHWKELWRDGKYDPWHDEKPGRVSLKEAIDAFIDEREIAESTKKSYRTTLEPFMETLSEEVPVASVEAKHVELYVGQKQLTGGTPRSYYDRLSMFFAFCLERNWIYEDPTSKVDPPSAPRRSSRSIFLPREFERILTAAQSDAILNPDREVCLDVYRLAIATGMRIGELCSQA